MAPALRGLFRALALAVERDSKLRRRLTLHFVGTSYASGDRAVKTVQPIAMEFGVADLVDERPARIPFFEALRCLLDADALILPGSDDPAYTASKLMPCLFARKPMLAIAHEDSPLAKSLREMNAGVLTTFCAGGDVDSLAGAILERWFQAPIENIPIVDREALGPYTARAMSAKLAAVFDHAVAAADRQLAAGSN
jgi:hypothetical protein